MKKTLNTASGTEQGLRISRLLYLCAIAVPFVVLISAELVLPGWIPTLPRPFRRALTEALLQAVLVVYGAIFLAGLVGTPMLGLLLAGSRRRGTFQQWTQARLRFRTVVPGFAPHARGRFGGVAKLDASVSVAADAIRRQFPWRIPACGPRGFERGRESLTGHGCR